MSKYLAPASNCCKTPSVCLGIHNFHMRFMTERKLSKTGNGGNLKSKSATSDVLRDTGKSTFISRSIANDMWLPKLQRHK